MAAKTAPWSLPPTTDPPGTIVVQLERHDPSHPGSGHRLLGEWTASCTIAGRRYSARSSYQLARHLAAVGIADAPLLIRTSGQGESRHASFHQLAGRR